MRRNQVSDLMHDGERALARFALIRVYCKSAAPEHTQTRVPYPLLVRSLPLRRHAHLTTAAQQQQI